MLIIMKLKNLWNLFSSEGEVIARFGEAALIRQPDGQWQLKGGTHRDQLAAREWISLFMHEVVLKAH